MSNTPTPSHKDSTTGRKPAVSAARRKLLKASAAAPLVATLHPGAAIAATSAFQCIGGDFSNKKFEDNGNSINGDTAVRIPVPFYKTYSGSSKVRINGQKKQLPNKLYLIDGMYYDQNGDEHDYITDDILEEKYEPVQDAHVLIVFDVTGNIPYELGPWPMVQIIDGSQQPLTTSCWTSISSSGSGRYM